MANRAGLDPELQAPLPRALSPRHWRECDRLGGLRLGLWLLLVSLIAAGAGAALFKLSSFLGVALGVFGGLLFLLAAMLSIGTVDTFVHDARLVKYGHAVSGSILENEGLPIPDGFGGYHDVRYCFVTLEGEEVRGCWSHAESPLWNTKAGDPVTILYLPNKPGRHLAYVCSAFRALS